MQIPVQSVVGSGLGGVLSQGIGQSGEQDAFDEAGFTGTAYAANTTQGTQWNFDVDALKVVEAGAFQDDSVRMLLGGRGVGHASGPVQVGSGQADLALEELGHGALKDQFPTQMPGPRPDIHDMIRGHDQVRFMFHHHHRIAQIPELVQQLNQAPAVPLVQANAGLIQNIERAYQIAAQGGGQFDALRLAARKAVT